MQRLTASTSSTARSCCQVATRNAVAHRVVGIRTLSTSLILRAEEGEEVEATQGRPANKSTGRRRDSRSPSSTSKRPPSRIQRQPAANTPGRQLYEELTRQRRGFPKDNVAADSSSSDTAKVGRPAGKRAAARSHQRVDLYLNETGYPQHKESVQGHESQDLHSSRREHLAPHPADEGPDALSAFVNDSAVHARAPSSRGNRSAAPRSSTTISRPGSGSGSGAPRSSREVFEGVREAPFSRGGRPSLASGPGPRGRPGVIASRPGPNGRKLGGKKPVRSPASTRPPRRSGSDNRPALVKPFEPAPQTVLTNKKSGYMLARPLPNEPAESLANVQKAALITQWTSQRKNVEKIDAEKGSTAAIMQGDWEKYVASVFAIQSAAKGAASSSKGTPQPVKAEALSRALKAVALNASLPVDGKLQVAKKLDSFL